jgi:hypothetical protein
MNHLTPDELVDAVEGTLPPDRQTHASTCAACREEAVRLTAILGEARRTEIPEPSPLYWDRFSVRVQEAIAEQDVVREGRIPQWLRWQVLAPLAGLALVLMALAVALPRTPVATDTATAIEAANGDAADLATLGAAGWAIVEEIIGPVDLEDAREAGIFVQPGDAERAALDLTAAEQQELLRLMKQEMDKSGG